MRLIWSALLTTGLLLVAMNVFEKRAQAPAQPGVTASDLEDGTGFPPPDPPPPPPPPK